MSRPRLKGEHGTIAQYVREVRGPRDPCGKCKVAWAEYHQQRRDKAKKNPPEESRGS